jgi:hypothetical protein
MRPATRSVNAPSALHLAVGGGHATIAALLLDKGAALDARDARGRTPLHAAAAASERAVSVCRLLLSKGADADAVDDDGKTPAEFAEWCTTQLFGVPMEATFPASVGEPPSCGAFNFPSFLSSSDNAAVAALLRRRAADEEAVIVRCPGLSAAQREWLLCSDALTTVMKRIAAMDTALAEDVFSAAEHAAKVERAIADLGVKATVGAAAAAEEERQRVEAAALAAAAAAERAAARLATEADAKALLAKLASIKKARDNGALDEDEAVARADASLLATRRCAAAPPPAVALARLHAWELFDTLQPSTAEVSASDAAAASPPLFPDPSW